MVGVIIEPPAPQKKMVVPLEFGWAPKEAASASAESMRGAMQQDTSGTNANMQLKNHETPSVSCIYIYYIYNILIYFIPVVGLE